MTQANYKTISPYASTAQVNNYLPYLDFWDSRVNIIPNPNDTYYIVTKNYEHRPDLLSYDLYGTTGYWWVFALRNPDVIQDPVYDLVPGIQIYVPQKASLPVNGY